MRRFLFVPAAFAALFLSPAPASLADPAQVTFDFDTPPVVLPDGSLQWVDGGTGVAIRAYRAPGVALDVANLVLLGVPDYGAGCLSPFGDPAHPEAIHVEFSNVPAGFGVERVDWDMGDFVGSDDDEWRVTTVSPGAADPVKVTHPAEVVLDSSFAGQVFGSSSRHVRRTHAISSWNFRGGSALFPMSLYVDSLVLTLNAVDVNGAFAGGVDEPESVPGGGGSGNNTSSDGGAGQTPIGSLIHGVESSGLVRGTTNGLVAILDAAESKLTRGDVDGAVQQLEVFVTALSAQAGKTVDPGTAADLAEDAETIIALLN